MNFGSAKLIKFATFVSMQATHGSNKMIGGGMVAFKSN